MLLFILNIVLLDILDKTQKEKLRMLRLKEKSTFNNDQSNSFVVDDRKKKQKDCFNTKLNQEKYSAQDLFLPSIKKTNKCYHHQIQRFQLIYIHLNRQ